MNPAFQVDIRDFQRALSLFRTTSKKSLEDILRQQCRLLVADIAKRTPPNDWAGSGKGKQAGENAITGDLFGGRSVNVGGFRAKTRGFFIVTDSKIEERDDIVSLFTNKKGEVYGVEKHLYRPNASVAEMIAHRDRYRSKKTGQMSKAGLRSRTVGRHVFIDRMIVRKSAANKFLKELHKRVGYMAAGWENAANQLRASLPAWITRHSAAGFARIEGQGDDFGIVITNRTVYPSVVGIVKRRVASALENRVYAMQAQAVRFLTKIAKDV